jgi:hypothetical protein
MIRNKSWAMLTEKEIKKESQLNEKEKLAVDSLLAALKGLPSSLCISYNDYDHEFVIQKRIIPGFARKVANLKKKSLFF